MSFTEVPSEFLDVDAWGVTATYNTNTTVTGVFGSAYSEVHGTEAEKPLFTCSLSDIPNVAHGDTLTYGGTDYSVVGVQPDEVDVMVTLVLSE